MSKPPPSQTASDQPSRDHEDPKSQPPKIAPDAHDPARDSGDDVIERLGSIRQDLKNIQAAHNDEQSTSENASRSIKEWEASLDLREDAVQHRESSIRDQRATLETSRKELNILRDALQQTSDDLDARVAAFQERDAQAIQAAEQLAKELAAAQEQLNHRDKDIASLREQASSVESSQHEAKKTRQNLESLQKQFESIQSDRSQLTKQINELQAAATSRTSEIKTLQKSQQDASKIATQLVALEKQLDASQAENKKLAKSSATFQSEIDSLRTSVAALESSKNDAVKTSKQLESVRAELGTLREERDALTQKLTQQEQDTASLQQSLESTKHDKALSDKLESEIARRDLVIEKLSDRVEASESDRDALQATVSKEAASNAGARVKLRLLRLSKMKSLMQAEGKKLARARRAVAQRHLDAERVLQQKEGLAKETASLQKRSEAITKLAKRNSMARVACMLAIAIGILGFGAWEVAKMVPATFLVNATLEAKGPLASDPEELAAWREHMTSMLTNTRLIDTAAERMGRRGLTEYASAPKLSAMVNNAMEFTFPAADTMSVSLVGVGDLKTERLLETYLAVFVSVTNDAAVSYGGSVSASITKAPTAEAKPLDEGRLLMMAGGIWGGVTFLVLGVSVWASSKFAVATAKLRKESSEATQRAFSYDGISQLPPAA